MTFGTRTSGNLHRCIRNATRGWIEHSSSDPGSTFRQCFFVTFGVLFYGHFERGALWRCGAVGVVQYTQPREPGFQCNSVERLTISFTCMNECLVKCLDSGG